MMTDEEVKQAELANLAAKIKTEYCRQYKIRNRKTYSPHKRYDDIQIWLTCAALVQKLKAYPEDFISAQFRYRPGTVLPSTLGGATAEKCYKQFTFAAMASADKLNLNGNDTDAKLPPGETELINRIAGLKGMLYHLTKDASLCTPTAIAAILKTPWMFDPFAVMVTSGFDPAIRKEFKQAALDATVDSPYLLRAAKSLNFNISYLDEED